MEYKGVEYLREKLRHHRTRVNVRYKYYEMKNVARDMDISTPAGLRHWFGALGWCSKAVDSLADRLIFREFSNDTFDLNGIYALNNPDILFDSAILGALISSCNFIYISQDEDGFPRLQVLDGSRATGIIDPITGMLYEGYAVLEEHDNREPAVEAYFLPGSTTYLYKDERAQLVGEDVVENVAEYPLLVPMIFRPDARRPFGHSRISRACMSITNSALRTVKRSEITSEFYSFPQKWVSGLAQDVEIDTWKATISSMIKVTKDADGDRPTFGQFTQQSMEPHVAELKMFAGLFAGETGLTLDDLGFSTNNPASAEAIKAQHENLRLTARKAQRTFGSGLLNAGFLAACLRDNYTYRRNQVYLTVPKWEPIFEPDAAVLSSIGDGAIKLNQAVPGFIGYGNLRDLTGIEGE
ncbi:phage portal protein [Candidatus Saccharibacteria bacterium]|nr:phage portal protein [Achromobacter sp.]MBQ3839384.1 phage portal protein [Fibrobacter sp.]MBQ6321123.1 phage portal protein [Candidatus Saccharibacteria bacterium]